MNFITLLKNLLWGQAVDYLNENFQKVWTELTKLNAKLVKNKGYYTTEAALIAAYPSPAIGDLAYVGTTYPGVVYDCVVAGTWHNTEEVPDVPVVDLVSYQTIAAAEADAILAYRELGACTTSTVPATYTAKDRVQYDFDAPVGNSVLTNFGGLTISSVTTPSRYKIKWNGTAWSAVLQTVIPESRIVQATGQSTTALMSQKAVTDELGSLELKVNMYGIVKQSKMFNYTLPVSGEISTDMLDAFIIDFHLIGGDSTKFYSPSLIKRNDSGRWQISVYQYDSIANEGELRVCELYTTVNPEQSGIAIHTLSTVANGITGIIAVDWSALVDGATYLGVSPKYNYSFRQRIHDSRYATIIYKGIPDDNAVTSSKIIDNAIINSKIVDNAVTSSKISNGSVIPSKASFLELQTGKNIFDKNASDIAIGYYINSNILSINPTFNTSGYIQVIAGETYTRSEEHNMSYYDSSKNYVSGILSTDNVFTFTIPAGISYIRTTCHASDWDTLQVELGSASTAYESYTSYYVLNGVRVSTSDITGLSAAITALLPENDLIIPSKLYFVSENQGRAYFQHFIKKWNPYKYYPRVTATGYSNRLNHFNSEAPTSVSGCNIALYDEDFSVIKSKAFDIIVGNIATDNGQIMIHQLGDSLTYTDAFMYKVRNILPNIVNDGMREPSYMQYTSDNWRCEGRGGWTLSDLFTEIYQTTSDTFSPFMQPSGVYKYFGHTAFWIAVMNGASTYENAGFLVKGTEIGFDSTTGLLSSPSTNDVMYNNLTSQYEVYNGTSWVVITAATLNFVFNYAKYRTVWNIAQADIVTIMYGTNDFRGSESTAAIDTTWASWVAQMDIVIASILADNAAAKIAIMIPNVFTGSMDNTLNVFNTKTTLMMWYFKKLLIEHYDGRESESIYLVDIGCAHDPEYGIKTQTEHVYQENANFNRILDNNSPHPTIEAYFEMGLILSGFIQAIR